MTGRPEKHFFLLLSCLILVLGMAACAELRLQTLPSPEPTAKLRVFFLPVSDAPRKGGFWATPHNVYAEQMAVPVRRFLRSTGIYEVVPQDDVKTVLGETAADAIQWDRRNWEAARKVGQALHADYVIVVRRGFQGFYTFRMLLINLETGKVYETFDHPGTYLTGSDQREEFRKIVRESYREIFNQARGDMLALAIRKGRISQIKASPKKPTFLTTTPSELKSPAVAPIVPPAPPPPPPVTVTAKKPSKTTVPEPETTKEVTPKARKAVKLPVVKEKAGPLITEARLSGKPRLVVYDLETPPPMQVAGLIITEALREEIHKVGSFDIVNREDLSKAMDELKLQQSGLVQEQGTVQMGRWLAARQSVSGRLDSLGSTTVLQTKRTDIETMGTLSFGSLRATAGREEDLLNGLPELARKLVQKP